MQPERPLYRYRFENAAFDAARNALQVDGRHVNLEQRPLQVLALLLERADETVPRAELFERVWQGRPTVDNVLANAIAKLRKGLGPRAGTRIVNVPRVGYRLRGPVERGVSGRRVPAALRLEPGQSIPGREHLALHTCLNPAAGGTVWLVRHAKTGARCVFKFATEAGHIDGLKREVTLHRLLRKSLGERDDLVRIIDWNFRAAPCWVQSEYAGCDLGHWVRNEPAFAAADCGQRVAWFLRIAEAVAAAHAAGVLHKDLKPGNILVARQDNGWQFRITDFGSGKLLAPARLDELGVTRLGLTVSGMPPADAGGTLAYQAQEVLAGAPPSVQGDVYALGLILFQLLVGDLHRTLAPGWRQGVADELLCEDIAAATYGDPARRLASVDALSARLRRLDARVRERRRLREADARALVAERALERSRARRPWLLAVIALLATSLTVSLWQLDLLRAARSEAQQQATLATATNRFLNEDLLGAGLGGGSPAWYQRNPRLREILDAAARRLDDGRFATEPLLLANLHQTLGRAYKSTADFHAAATQLRAAADGFTRALGADDPRGVLASYELATVLARLSAFDAAGTMLARADAGAGPRLAAPTEIALRSQLAHGDVAYQQMHVD